MAEAAGLGGVADEGEGAGAPGEPAGPGEPEGPGTGTGTTVVEEGAGDGDGAGTGVVVGGFTTVWRSQALSAAAAAIKAARCMSLLFMGDSRYLMDELYGRKLSCVVRQNGASGVGLDPGWHTVVRQLKLQAMVHPNGPARVLR